MKQAKVLTVAERKRLLAVIAKDRHSERNRLAVMLSFLAGLRVGEIAAIRVNDVVDGEGRVRDQLRLNPAYTKGGVSRTIFVNKRLQREIRRYLDSLPAFLPLRVPCCPARRAGGSPPTRSANCSRSSTAGLGSTERPATAVVAASSPSSPTAAFRPR